jgi:N-acyl-phosphatidylethanolamine-hydrolysing phospholipase D
VNPDEAVMIHKDIGALQSIGMHWGTYPLTAEEPMDPPVRLAAARLREGLGPLAFRAVDVGQTITLH